MELVVLSGKGGTGKTTIATALAELENDVIRVDCDVDAPNLYLFYKGKDIKKEDFISGKKANINKSLCNICGKCEEVCKFNSIKDLKVDPLLCEGCGACTLVCSNNAITMEDEKTADTYITLLDKGVISRAQMKVGSDGSGKLINKLKLNAKEINNDNKLIIIDGSPGIGCSVISSITGSDLVLIVTEPTKSGIEDLKRVIKLCKHFNIFTLVCINKYDINELISNQIEEIIKNEGIVLVGKIPYDETVMRSINELKPITDFKDSIANKAIENIYLNIKKLINNKNSFYYL